MGYFYKEHFDYCSRTHRYKELHFNWDIGKFTHRNLMADLFSASCRGPTETKKYASNSLVSYLPETPAAFYES